MRRWSYLSVFAVLWVLGTAGVASADPPGPTDYLSEVVDIDPNVAGIEVEIVGGDSFVLLTVAPGIGVDVVGYSGEPYLRFLPDGTVEENQLAPSKYLNEDRYAAGEIPTEADATAEPRWMVVADDGAYAWHDHRTHWMNEIPPPGRGPGDQVAEGVVPLFVDGVEVDVTVASVWQDPPSSLPVVLGLAGGVLLAIAMIRRRSKLTAAAILGLAAVALVAGGTAYLSVPTETAPPWSLWVFPLTSALLSGVVLLGRGRSEFVARYESFLLLIAALELVGWGVAHWGWLWPAILPTALPFWMDRFVGAVTLVGALGATAAVVAEAVAPQRRY
ncbi:MAG: hypothetical protein QNJ81_14610 [Acidimicrobiia bacterium]|nr:hypothetical protein [Acidimicrobiia bacterium]